MTREKSEKGLHEMQKRAQGQDRNTLLARVWSWFGKPIKQKAGRKADCNIKAKGRRGMCNCSDHQHPNLGGEGARRACGNLIN